MPPFLIMKDDGEVWQLATGEASVCWKCGGSGHIGDKCRQAVNILAESIASPAVGVQPSWAHVVKGGVSLVVSPPPPPPAQRQQAQQLTFFKLSAGILRAGKTNLRAVQFPPMKCLQVGRVLDGTEAEPMRAVEVASMEVQLSAIAVDDDLNDQRGLPSQKKAKLSSETDVPRDPRLRVKPGPVSLSSSPELHHKVPAGEREQRHGLDSEGDHELGADREGAGLEVGSGGGDKVGIKTNMHGVNYVMWFDISILGKDSMDPEEED